MIQPAASKIFHSSLAGSIIEILMLPVVSLVPPPAVLASWTYGRLASKERALTTTNRNFVGRIGHPDSEAYLASPAVAAATGIDWAYHSSGRSLG